MRTKYTLQLDDDITLSYTDIMTLGGLINQSQKRSVSPLIRYDSYRANVSHAKESAFKKLSEKLNYIILGIESKEISYGETNCAGVPLYLTPECSPNNNKSVDYASGGAMLHYTENLILYDYYPFDGRADYEDIYHCFYLKQNGVDIIAAVNVFGDHDEIETTFTQTFKNILCRAFIILRRYNQLSGRGNIRLCIWIIALCGQHFLMTLMSLTASLTRKLTKYKNLLSHIFKIF